jgi:hypothetical protein
MAQVIIHRRERVSAAPLRGVREDRVAVTWSTGAIPPRVIHLAPDLYRPATEEELADRPAELVVPVDPAAEEEERKAIRADLDVAARQRHTLYDL